MAKNKDFFVGKYSIIGKDVVIGDRSKIWNYCKLYYCQIGANTEIGSYCEVKNDVKIGNNCIIKSYVSFAKGTRVGDFVFIGPRAVFLNDNFPSVRAVLEKSWTLEGIVVEDEVTIGGGAVILPGIKVEKGAFIGAGSVVTRNIPPDEIWIGNPARFFKRREE